MRNPRTLLAAAAFLAGLTLGAPAAQAGVLVTEAASCDTYVFEEPFVRWLDPASYVLTPDGTFERGARGWTLSGGARVIKGNEPYYVHRRRESHLLWLPSGSSATTPAMCVGIEYPTLRTFALNRRFVQSALQVEVLFEDVLGDVQSLPIALLNASSTWEPTPPMPVVANLLPLLPNNRTAVAFRFSPQDAAGDWRIDDVYVDPYRSR
jgi:hypothetical protein